MCDLAAAPAPALLALELSETIINLNTLGVMKFRAGLRQEAMDSFQASTAHLINYVSWHNNLLSLGSSKRKCPHATTTTKSDEHEHGQDAHHHQNSTDVEQPPSKRRRTSVEESSTCCSSCQEEQQQQKGESKQPPTQEREQSKLQPSGPYAVPISWDTTTTPQDKIPEQAMSLFNQVLVLPQVAAIEPDQYDMIYATLLFNMALVLHNYGLQYCCGKTLTKALETYEVAHKVLLFDLRNSNVRATTNTVARDDQSKPCHHGRRNVDVHHWLLYAIWNNMANIYVTASSPVMVDYCLNRLRMALTYSDSCLLQQQDLLFFMVNLDVLGAGPGVISASAA